METCANCDRKIGKLETPHVFEEQVVCEGCADVLLRQKGRAMIVARSGAPSSPPREPPPSSDQEQYPTIFAPRDASVATHQSSATQIVEVLQPKTICYQCGKHIRLDQALQRVVQTGSGSLLDLSGNFGMMSFSGKRLVCRDCADGIDFKNQVVGTIIIIICSVIILGTIGIIIYFSQHPNG